MEGVATKSIGIALNSIQEVRYHFNYEYDFSKIEDNTKNSFNIVMKHRYSYDLEKNLFMVDQVVIYSDSDSDSDADSIMEVEVKFTFLIPNIKDILIEEKNNEFSFNIDILPTLHNIVIGTMRGIIYAKTALTPLCKYPLPIIGLQDLLSNTTGNKKSDLHL